MSIIAPKEMKTTVKLVKKEVEKYFTPLFNEAVEAGEVTTATVMEAPTHKNCRLYVAEDPYSTIFFRDLNEKFPTVINEQSLTEFVTALNDSFDTDVEGVSFSLVKKHDATHKLTLRIDYAEFVYEENELSGSNIANYSVFSQDEFDAEVNTPVTASVPVKSKHYDVRDLLK